MNFDVFYKKKLYVWVKGQTKSDKKVFYMKKYLHERLYPNSTTYGCLISKFKRKDIVF
jgi:hypothetical protein